MKSICNIQKILSVIMLIIFSFLAQAACKDPAPRVSEVANSGGGSCPSGYFSSGKSCVAV